MRLFVDLDETCICTVFDDFIHRMTTPPFGTITLETNYFVYLRPDLHLLRGTPFEILTAASIDYAEAAVAMLRDSGLTVTAIHAGEELDAINDGVASPITTRPSLHIDDLPGASLGIEYKRRAVPAMTLCQIMRFGSRPVRPKLGVPYETAIHHDPERFSLAECLETYRRLIAA